MKGAFDALAAEIYKDKVRRARLATPEEKLLAGEELLPLPLVLQWLVSLGSTHQPRR
jgi:hypothetical protein